jgi:hypothetical protein
MNLRYFMGKLGGKDDDPSQHNENSPEDRAQLQTTA